MGKLWNSGMPINPFGAGERTKYNDGIRMLNSSFYNDTELHHNDINYKNVLRNDTGKLYLIDFEASSHYNTERNLDKIL